MMPPRGVLRTALHTLCMLSAKYIAFASLSVEKYGGTLSEVIVINDGRTFAGLDRRTFAPSMRFTSGYFPGGHCIANGRIYIADNGARAASFGRRISMYGDGLSPAGSFPACALPVSPAYHDGKLFVGSAVRSADGTFAFQVFDAEGTLLKEWHDDAVVYPGKGVYRRGTLYIPVKYPGTQRTNRICAVDTASLTRTELFRYNRRHPFEPFGIVVQGDSMAIVYFHTHEIEVFDLAVGGSKVIALAKLTALPKDRTGIVLANAVFHDKELTAFIHYHMRPGNFQALVSFDARTHQHLRAVTLDARHTLSSASLSAIAGEKVLFGDGSIFHRYTGALIGTVFR